MSTSLLPVMPADGGPSFYQADLDALPDNIAILNHHGVIVDLGVSLDANLAWREFAQVNGARGASIGSNYLEICDACADHDPVAAEIGGALREILAGRCTSYDSVHPCCAPGQQRWFAVRIAQLHGDGDRRVVIRHHDITATLRVEEADQRFDAGAAGETCGGEKPDLPEFWIG